jgi:DNA-directed RNA polymerase subunit RPC12/RpoP
VSLEGLSSKSQRIKLAVAVVVLVIAGFFGFRTYGGKSLASLSAERVYKCVEPGCGHLFEHTIQIGDTEPLVCPKCGKSSAWKTEACYWAKDASGNWKAKLEPTFVVLKSRIDPESTERTYCPDCGHEVVGHNRRPPNELMEAAKKEAGK